MEGQQSNKNWERFKVSGGQLADKVKELIHEGNVRRIHIEQNGKTVLKIPVTFVAVGVLLAPMLTALGTLAALVTDCSIAVERESPPEKPSAESEEPS